MTTGSLHEILHVIGQVPGKVVVFPNDTVLGEGGDEGYDHELDIGYWILNACQWILVAGWILVIGVMYCLGVRFRILVNLFLVFP